jgi:hypothetical protein
MATIQTLARWIDENGYRSSGHVRELTLECPDDPDKWVTELQEPITPDHAYRVPARKIRSNTQPAPPAGTRAHPAQRRNPNFSHRESAGADSLATIRGPGAHSTTTDQIPRS